MREVPVIKLALSLRRKLAAYATSAGKANRAIAARDAIASAYYSSIRTEKDKSATYPRAIPSHLADFSLDPPGTDGIYSDPFSCIIEGVGFGQA